MVEGEQWGNLNSHRMPKASKVLPREHRCGRGLHGDRTEMPTKVEVWDMPSSYRQESKAVVVMPTHGSQGRVRGQGRPG